ncbi:Oidioi.mRNA.OKI2018_I69.XSR.g13552.t1.cds [Oikopleura dioica]|uniref:Oidioi.mRNA.OKI2018_I69.XSR.g13552.t1.cds n=1 Tax=Oikopleura dioica TaxID=34765 RepID=A0ABN7SE53_OIKDI|nr:Oidioi.mRNA.OKI2018_I69.XSR.g13552.t1.cds [Oikopleura dioica]
MDQDKKAAQNRRNRLRYWTKKLTPKLGAGHFQGNEGWPGKNGPEARDHFYDEELEKGEQDKDIVAHGWRVKFVGCCKDLNTDVLYGDGFHHFSLEKIGGGPKIKCEATEYWWYYDHVVGSEKTKVTEGGKIEMKLKRQVRSAYVVVNCWILPEDSPVAPTEESSDEEPDHDAAIDVDEGGCSVM